MRGSRPRYTQQQMIDTLIKVGGLKGPAAKSLHCARMTINNYIKRYPAVKQAQEDALQDTIDLAQSQLVSLVKRGEWPAIRFLLVTLGKDRGFTERQEIVAVGSNTEARRQQFLDDYDRVYGDEGD